MTGQRLSSIAMGMMASLIMISRSKPPLPIDGNVSFNANDLYEGKYQLIETKAPVGYVIPTDLAKGVDVEITGDQTLKFPTIEEPVFRRAVTLTRLMVIWQPNCRHTYALYREDGTELAKDLVTDEKVKSPCRLIYRQARITLKKPRSLPPYRPIPISMRLRLNKQI